jgi:hypothetical protein
MKVTPIYRRPAKSQKVTAFVKNIKNYCEKGEGKKPFREHDNEKPNGS